MRRAIGLGLRRAIRLSSRPHWQIPFGPARGIRLEFDEHAPFDLWFGLYESELFKYVRGFCRPGFLSFDIGAHGGYYSLLFAKLTGSRVTAFEADGEAVLRIGRNCDANPALGNLIEVRQAYVAFETNPAVNAVTLDELLEAGEVFAPDMVKVDVDRAETSVLTGARKLLSEARPHLIVETHSLELERECGDLLLQCGYAPRVVTQRRWLAENRPISHNRWLVAPGAERKRRH